MKALSVRQPWAWLIVAGHKPIENRTWTTEYRGPLLIHASSTPAVATMHQEDLLDAIARETGVTLDPDAFKFRGGIVGVAELWDVVTKPRNERERVWFEGPYGWAFRDARPVSFLPCPGQLSLFDVAWVEPWHLVNRGP